MKTFDEAWQAAEATPGLLHNLNAALGAGRATTHHVQNTLQNACDGREERANDAGVRLRSAVLDITGTTADQARQAVLAFPLSAKTREAFCWPNQPPADDAAPPPQPPKH